MESFLSFDARFARINYLPIMFSYHHYRHLYHRNVFMSSVPALLCLSIPLSILTPLKDSSSFLHLGLLLHLAE